MEDAATEDDFTLDEARDTFFTLQRACQQFSAKLGKVVETLNGKKPDDEWLLEVLDEAEKGVHFHQQQLTLFKDFHARANAYIEEVRTEAHQLALSELSVNAQGGDNGTEPAGNRTKASKIVHPELQKFKQEKQARILGKYGGIPALGAMQVLPRMPRDAILKATASPAAREIRYSKVEQKDATFLAEVMRFKPRKSDVAEGSSKAAASPWQAELSAKKGKAALDGTDEKDQVTPSTKTHTVYAEELGAALQRRQAALETAMVAEKLTNLVPAGPKISEDANVELAEKLRHRQSVAKKMAEDEAAAAAEVAEAAATPATPAWGNAAAPFGSELTAVIQRRAEQQRSAAAEEASSSRRDTGSPEDDKDGGTSRPFSFISRLQMATPPSVGDRRAVPPSSLPAKTPSSVQNELEEKLRRLSARKPSAPAAAKEAD